MTPAQNILYWRRWGAVVAANAWRMQKGRLVAEAVRDASEHHIAVWNVAEELAAKQHRAVVADDLRHGCHVYALKSDMPHAKMPNTAFDRLLTLWGDGRHRTGLLIEPDCIASRLHWDNPHQGAIDRTKAMVARFPEAYVRQICASRFGTRMWENLGPADLRQLSITLSERTRSRHANPF